MRLCIDRRGESKTKLHHKEREISSAGDPPPRRRTWRLDLFLRGHRFVLVKNIFLTPLCMNGHRCRCTYGCKSQPQSWKLSSVKPSLKQDPSLTLIKTRWNWLTRESRSPPISISPEGGFTASNHAHHFSIALGDGTEVFMFMEQALYLPRCHSIHH